MKVTLDAPIGGLGDALLFSTLPELYAYRGDQVYISERTDCRNPEAFDLVYAQNPYIEGVLAREAADLVIGIPHEREFFFEARKWRDPITCMEALHGFPSATAIRQRPRIYYEPKWLDEWHDRVFVDPSSISQEFPEPIFEDFCLRLFDPQSFDLRIMESKYSDNHGSMRHFAPYVVRDIYEYIDIIASCKAFVCTESGSQSLAAAVRRDGIYALCTTMTFNSRFYIYPAVNYTVTGALSRDYLWNDLTAEQVGHP
ncbi:MAG: hypothetical protein ACYDBO_02180 [Vulcanimicrobiaceae bacterium]